MTTILKGPSVELRPVEKHHVPLFAEMFSQYELLRLLAPGTVAPVNLPAEEAWFDSICKDKTSWTFSIIVNELKTHAHGGVIGNCTLMGFHGKNRSATMGIAIGDAVHRGKGFGTEAIKLLMEFGFLEMNLNRIELQVLELNAPARKLYERLGFKLEGTLRQSLFREGRYWDTYIMSMLRSEYTPDARWGL